MNTIQELDKECLEDNIEKLIVLTNKKAQLESEIDSVKSAISNYAKENGQLYSDSSYTVSLVYTPKLLWKSPVIQNCDLHISDYDKQIKELEKKSKEFKDKKNKELEALKTQMKEECEAQNKSISEMWDKFSFVELKEDSYHIRIDKTSKKTDHDRTWIYKK